MEVVRGERERRFDALFGAYLADIVAYCGWRAPSVADAQDAVSEVFLTAWRRLDDVPAGDAARSWLYGTARRVLANQARAERRRTRLHVRLSYTAEPDIEAHSETAPSPGLDVVRTALGAMTAADQEVLLLAEWEGLSPAQIGTVLGCPAVTARGRLFRARRRFRAAYEAAASRPHERRAGPEPLPGPNEPLLMTTSRGVVE